MAGPLVLEPGVPAMELADAKRHLRVTGAHDDDLIRGLIEAAQLHVENVTERALTTTVFEQRFDVDGAICDRLELRRRPVRSIVDITSGEAGGTVPRTEYAISGEDGVRLSRSVLLTSPVVVRYSAGYGEPAAVPRPILQAMQLLIASWYANREAVTTGDVPRELPLGVDALLSSYKVWGP